MGMVILGYGVEFLIQAVFLFLGLWIMIKVQRLNFNYVGLVGTSVLASVIEMIVDHLLGGYFSTGAVAGVLFFCVWKVTQADQVDVAFTVAVGTALVFGMNLFLLGWLMGDLRPSAREHELPDRDEEVLNTKDARTDTNHAARATDSQPGEPTVRPDVAAESGVPLSREVIPVATQAIPPSKTQALVNGFALKAITPSPKLTTIIINTGLKNYTLALGESLSMQTPEGPVSVRCKSVGTNWATLQVADQNVLLRLKAP